MGTPSRTPMPSLLVGALQIQEVAELSKHIEAKQQQRKKEIAELIEHIETRMNETEVNSRGTFWLQNHPTLNLIT
jgi:hypothetical protein